MTVDLDQENRDRGFSLVELLVVIVILGVLSTVVVFAVRGGRTEASAAACDADRATISRAEEVFSAERGTYGTEDELVDSGVLHATSEMHDVQVSDASYLITDAARCVDSTTSSGSGVAQLKAGSIPGSVVAGQVIDPPLTVTLLDEKGATSSIGPTSVTLSLEGADGATLSGTTTVLSVDGVATFSDLTVDKAGADYRFTAAADGAVSTFSSLLEVTAADAVKLGFVGQPESATKSVAFATQPLVAVQDRFGNAVATATADISMAITSGTGSAGAQLTCTASSISPTNGFAGFDGCQINKTGSGYSLTATATDLASAVSNVFDVNGTASKLAVVTQPNSAVAGATLAPIVVVIQDSSGNLVVDSTATVTMTINKNIASMSGTFTVDAIDGVATFSDLAIVSAAASYRLTMTSTGLKSTNTATFDVTPGAATQLAFSKQPGGGKAAKNWSSQPSITIQDSYGNIVSTGTADIQLDLDPATGPAGATLSCKVNPRAAVGGTAKFAGCQIDHPGTGYVITATSDSLNGTRSEPLTIT